MSTYSMEYFLRQFSRNGHVEDMMSFVLLDIDCRFGKSSATLQMKDIYDIVTSTHGI